MRNVSLGFNGTVKIVDLPAGAWTPITPSKAGVRGVVVRESMVNAAGAMLQPQGFQAQIGNDGSALGFTTVFLRPAYNLNNAPGEFPEFRFFNRLSEHGVHGEVIATYQPPFGGVPYYMQLQPLTGVTTSVEIWEYC